MKKYLMIGALGIFALASCKKDYMCECTNIERNQADGSTTITNSSATYKGTKDQAEKNCDGMNYGSPAVNTERICTLNW